ncbi:conserved hypothetical protein [Ricinus communis]|uniref:Uncharacterized protein n=1 Tax=Ricinus communis TaxID=3988 RepID=B9T8L2_RICCO|nr:conserved hypothetical protein [Ricinus communis]
MPDDIKNLSIAQAEALRTEFANFCVQMEKSIKAQHPKLTQLETLSIIAVSCFQANKDQAARIVELEEALKGAAIVADTAGAEIRVLRDKLAEQVTAYATCASKRDALVDRFDTSAARDVIAERQRQVAQEGWTPEHDDEHIDGEMAAAAAVYVLHGSGWHIDLAYQFWPPHWNANWWKPTTSRRDLVKGAALILAEIERLDRAAASKVQP